MHLGAEREIMALAARSADTASFRGHGVFIYDTPETIADYGSIADTVKAIQAMDMRHAWVRIHGTSAYPTATKKTIAGLIAALKEAGIAVAGWGWNQGDSPKSEATLAAKELAFFELTDYIADIEQGVHEANWTEAEVADYCKRVRDAVSGGFGVTSFPLIDWHEPKLMQAALPYVDMVNPQVYWFDFPSTTMLKQFKRPNGSPYTAHDPTEYAALCLDRWTKLMGGTPKKIVMTGQAYWGENGFTQSAAEAKLDAFLPAFTAFNRIIGLNWWHLGGVKAMSHHMYEALKQAKLGSKRYAA
jgi:hypothetical protein